MTNDESMQKISILLWSIWSASNARIWKRRISSTTQTIQAWLTLLYDWLQAKAAQKGLCHRCKEVRALQDGLNRRLDLLNAMLIQQSLRTGAV